MVVRSSCQQNSKCGSFAEEGPEFVLSVLHVRTACAARLFFHIRPIKFIINGLVVAAHVVDAKDLHLPKSGVHHLRV